MLSWLRMPDRPSAETYIKALRSIDRDFTERLLRKLSPDKK